MATTERGLMHDTIVGPLMGRSVERYNSGPEFSQRKASGLATISTCNIMQHHHALHVSPNATSHLPKFNPQIQQLLRSPPK